jgi:uncharacterized protein
VSEHPSSSDAVQRVVVWRSLFAEGTDYCALWRTQNGWALRGTAISLPRQGNPILAHYHVHCDAAWQTQRVDVERVLDGRAEAMHFIMESAGMWRSGNRELLSIAGCVDVDLAITPATNTLPIRRLKHSHRRVTPIATAGQGSRPADCCPASSLIYPWKQVR